MLTHMRCLKTAATQKRIVRVQMLVIQNSYKCERLPLEYVQICVHAHGYPDLSSCQCKCSLTL